MKKVLLTRPFRPEDTARFEGIPGVSLLYNGDPDGASLKGVEGIIGSPAPSVVLSAPDLKWLQVTSAGVDGYLKVPEIVESGLVITNLSGAFGRSISEFCLTMCLMLMKHMQRYRDNQNEHVWRDEGRQASPVGKDLLILGAGNLGTATARLFRPFRCRITGMRRSARAVPPEFDEMITMDGLDDALQKADIIVCALPETPETHKLLNAKRLQLLKKTAILINVGRGPLIDCGELALRLNAGLLWGAALDVTDPEPLPKDHPLWSARNAIVTPHITGGSFGHLTATEEKLFEICRENLRRFAEGLPFLNVVDRSTGYRTVEERF